jgi:regulation of enolase protein 1 (concanavalin A-like superfamily)
MQTMKKSSSILFAFILTTATFSAPAANIVWVSDANDPAVGFFPAGSGYTDSGFVTLLQNAGHNVIRFNQPNAQATVLTQEQLDALNTNDLIILSRAVASGALQPDQGPQWNTSITTPIIDISAFHVRMSRLGWFTANEAPDVAPTTLGGALTGDPAADEVTDYLFRGVLMNGTNTALPYDEWMDRGSNPVLGVPVAGGIVHAAATYVRDDNGAAASGIFIAGFPAGTAVRAGADILGGYRMFFAAGSRESSVAPNAIPLYTARENLSPVGESIFLRAVQVAINDGLAPATDPNAPIVFTQQPANATVLQNSAVTFSAIVTGAGPRTLQWQRDVGDGVTFTNIPDAVTPFTGTSITLSNLGPDDNNARFRVEASNAQGVVRSAVATLTVTPDTAAPVPQLASTFDGLNVVICFNERLDTQSAEEEFNYSVAGEFPLTALVRPDGRSVDLTLSQAVAGPTFPVSVSFISDAVGNSINPAVQLSGVRYGLTSTSIGTVNPPGTNNSCASNVFVITAGGVDLTAATDTFHFLHETVSGDFDARVRVASLERGSRLETTSKAILSARATTDPTSAAINVFINPSYPADNNVIASVRPTTGSTTTNSIGGAPGNGLPNAWLRITREGDVFTTYRSTNGTVWVQLGSATVALGPTAEVGMGVASHRAGHTVTATFTDFSVTQGAAQPQIVNPAYTGSSFTASFDTQSGTTYVVEFNNDLNTSNWQTLATVPGDGNPYTINDAGPLPSKRFYRVRVQ